MIRKLFLSASIHVIFLGTIGFLLGMPSSSLKVPNLMMVHLVSLPEGPTLNSGKIDSRMGPLNKQEDPKIVEKIKKQNQHRINLDKIRSNQKVRDDSNHKEISILDSWVEKKVSDVQEGSGKVPLDFEDDSSLEGERRFLEGDVLQEELAYSHQVASDAVDSELKKSESLQENYLYEVWVRLKKAKRYPWMARLRGQEGTVKLQFSIDNSGWPEEINVLESSGWKLLDHEALSLVRRIGQFPNPPIFWKEGILIQVPLVFELRAS